MKNYRLFIATLAITFSLSAPIDTKKAQEYESWLHTFGEVIALFNEYYFKDISPAESMALAIKAFSEQDPHTLFLNEKSCTELHEKLSEHFYGIGVVLPGDKKKVEDFLSIIEIMPGGPAEKAGLQMGDKIVQIDTTVVKGLDLEELMPKLRGEKHTKVSLKILRSNHQDPLTITVTRDVVKNEISMAYFFPEQQVMYLLLTVFSEKSSHHVKKMLEKAIEKKAKGIILDLRNNTGGLFDSAIEMAGFFLPKGSLVVSIKKRDGSKTSEWKTTTTPLAIPPTTPIFIIVNNYTASSSEILTGVLQLYAAKKDLVNVFVVGEETFGKGSVQEVIPVSNKGAVKLTTGLYYLAFDVCIQEKGITPDFPLEMRTPPTETMRWLTTSYGKESSLHGHIQHTETSKKDEKTHKHHKEDKTKEDKSWKERRQDIISNDYFIQNTLTLIKLYHLGIATQTKKTMPRSEILSFMKNNFMIDTVIKLEEFKIE